MIMQSPYPMDLEALAVRVEAASATDRELFEAAYAAINGASWPTVVYQHGSLGSAPDYAKGEAARRFGELVNVQAWLEAAITLVPETADSGGERFRLEQWNSNGVHAAHVRASAWVAGAARVYAATTALALTAAALRARASDLAK